MRTLLVSLLAAPQMLHQLELPTVAVEEGPSSTTARLNKYALATRLTLLGREPHRRLYEDGTIDKLTSAEDVRLVVEQLVTTEAIKHGVGDLYNAVVIDMPHREVPPNASCAFSMSVGVSVV